MSPLDQNFAYMQPKTNVNQAPRAVPDPNTLEQRKPFVLNPPEKSEKSKDDMKKLKRSNDDEEDENRKKRQK